MLLFRIFGVLPGAEMEAAVTEQAVDASHAFCAIGAIECWKFFALENFWILAHQRIYVGSQVAYGFILKLILIFVIVFKIRNRI